MATKITEKTEITINDLSKAENDLQPHFDKIIKAIKYFGSHYIKITSHIEQMGDKTIINFDIEDTPRKRK